MPLGVHECYMLHVDMIMRPMFRTYLGTMRSKSYCGPLRSGCWPSSSIRNMPRLARLIARRCRCGIKITLSHALHCRLQLHYQVLHFHCYIICHLTIASTTTTGTSTAPSASATKTESDDALFTTYPSLCYPYSDAGKSTAEMLGWS